MKEIYFNKYEKIKSLGKGSFGEVFLVRDLHINKLLAMKIIPVSKYVLTEVNTLKELNYAGLPRIYDYRKDDENAFLIMEYIEGITLREYLDKFGKLEINKSLKIAKDLCHIIKYLHKLKPSVIYRDLKPENIVIKPNGDISLIDFGAVLIKKYNFESCHDNYGTIGYTDPELFKGKEADYRSDIYSIGAILHEMISGINVNKPPYRRPELKDVEPASPWGISYIVSKCLNDNSVKRYNNIDELLYDLNNYKKISRSKKVMLTIVRILVIALLCYAFFLFINPLVHGLDENMFPIPYLCKPMFFLVLSFLLNLIFLKSKKKNSSLKLEKDIFITDKRYVGLIAVIFFSLGILSNTIWGIIEAPRAYAYSEDAEPSMWVDLCDVNERHVLLKGDTEYEITDKVRLEIPKSELPNEKLTVKIVAYTKNGKTYSSKSFNVKKADD